MNDLAGLTDIMEAMVADCRFVGASATRKFYGVILKCVRTKRGFRWYAEGRQVKKETMIKMTATNQIQGD